MGSHNRKERDMKKWIYLAVGVVVGVTLEWRAGVSNRAKDAAKEVLNDGESQ